MQIDQIHMVNIEQIINSSRCAEESFLPDSKAAAKDIIAYLVAKKIIPEETK